MEFKKVLQIETSHLKPRIPSLAGPIRHINKEEKFMKKKPQSTWNRVCHAYLLTLVVLTITPYAMAQTPPPPAPSKPATEATKAANRAVQQYLNFNDKADFEDAQRGFIGKPDTLTIKNAKGNVVWDLETYKKYIGLDKPAPDTVNPSLWRNAQLNMQYGLFKVHDRIFQVRGYDLSNITSSRATQAGSCSIR